MMKPELNKRQKAFLAVQQLDAYLNTHKHILDEAERLTKEAKTAVVEYGETTKIGGTTVVYVKAHTTETLALTASAMFYTKQDAQNVQDFLLELMSRNKLFMDRLGRYLVIQSKTVAAYARVSRK